MQGRGAPPLAAVPAAITRPSLTSRLLCPLPPACSVMQESTASRGLEQIAGLMAEGKVKVVLDK